WGDTGAKRRNYGKGVIFQEVTLQEVFEALKIIPDCGLDKKDNVFYSHRTLPDGTDAYFVFNHTGDAYSFSPVFREGKGRQPELWDPVQGTMRKLPAYENQGDATLVPLHLEKHESVFIVFREKGKPQSKDLLANFPELQTVTGLNSAWEVSFNSDAVHRGPDETVSFTELQDWKTSADPRIKFYSGTAIYKNKFTLPENATSQDLFLDLGKVGMMAKVKVNGQYAGGVWTAPYHVNISKQAKAGENTLEIKVVNTWVNRLIGDRQVPEQDRITHSRFTNWEKESDMQSSGLIGPVKVVSASTSGKKTIVVKV
ncbi:MAG: glycoside hydrolase family 2, partial [Tannerella sp.]|nr:glycoside hydrolase family 2 [Tannerella sp.]